MGPAPELLTEALRGDRARRPRRDTDSAAGLRSVLEDHVFEVFGAKRRECTVKVSSATLRTGDQILEFSDSSLSRARGILISTIFRLLVAHVHIDDPYEDALSAWRGERPHDELLGVLNHLDADQCARLRADVSSHFE